MPKEVKAHRNNYSLFASYIAYSLLMPKDKLFPIWYEYQENSTISNLNLRFSYICEQLSSILNINSYDVRIWQWMLRYQFISYKNTLIGNSSDLNLARFFANMVKEEVKSTNVDKIIQHFGGCITTSTKASKEFDYYPLPLKTKPNFCIYVSPFSKMTKIMKEERILFEFCDFFFDGEATREEKEAFATEFLPKSTTHN